MPSPWIFSHILENWNSRRGHNFLNWISNVGIFCVDDITVKTHQFLNPWGELETTWCDVHTSRPDGIRHWKKGQVKPESGTVYNAVCVTRSVSCICMQNLERSIQFHFPLIHHTSRQTKAVSGGKNKTKAYNNNNNHKNEKTDMRLVPK